MDLSTLPPLPVTDALPALRDALGEGRAVVLVAPPGAGKTTLVPLDLPFPAVDLDLLGNPVEAHFGALPERPTEIWEMRCDNTRAREILGWKPQYSLTEGLKKTIEWYRQNAAWWREVQRSR